PGLALLVFIFGFGKSQLAHGIPGKWLIESPDYGKVGEFFRGSLAISSSFAPMCSLLHFEQIVLNLLPFGESTPRTGGLSFPITSTTCLCSIFDIVMLP
ncbi:hypothetical protein, partial [Alcanivorax jadensis]|uniref:hypothetical protein n=1 Tax=Alcanivorax jadensis TaxID=64988 RepID=UPI0026EC56D6